MPTRTRTPRPLEVDELVKVTAPGYKGVFVIRGFRDDGCVELFGGKPGFQRSRIVASVDVLTRAKKGTLRPESTSSPAPPRRRGTR